LAGPAIDQRLLNIGKVGEDSIVLILKFPSSKSWRGKHAAD
jgi:hypothetical protein